MVGMDYYDGEEVVTTDFSYITSNADLYTWMWVGYFKADETGVYQFKLNSDDSSLLWVGPAALNPTMDNLTVDCRGTHGPQDAFGSAALVSGTYYPIRLLFGEATGGDSLAFSWRLPGGPDFVYDGDGVLFRDINTWQVLGPPLIPAPGLNSFYVGAGAPLTVNGNYLNLT